MSTPEIERVADEIHNTFVSAYAIEEKVSQDWLKNVLKELLTTHDAELREKIEKLRDEAENDPLAVAAGMQDIKVNAFNDLLDLLTPKK